MAAKQGYWATLAKTRTSRRRLLGAGAGISAALAAISMVGCGGGGGTQKEDSSGLISKPVDSSNKATKGGIYSNVTAVSNFDVTRGAQENAQTAIVYSRLVKYQTYKYPDKALPNIVPDAAQSWETSPDGLSVTYKLRPNMKYDPRPPTNGKLLTSADVKYAWDLFATKGAGRTNLVNAADPDGPVVSVSTPDASTVVFKLAFLYAPLGPMLAANRHVQLLPTEAEDKYSIKSDMRGTAAWRLKEFLPDARIVYEKNPDWYDASKVYLDGLTYYVIPQYAARLAQFRAGAIATFPVNQEDVLQTKADVPSLQMQAETDFDQTPYWLRFGYLPDSPFRDERVRKAASMTLDRDLYNETFGNLDQFRKVGLEPSAAWNSCLGAGEVWWLNPQDTKLFGDASKWFKHDLAEAKKLMSAAGYTSTLESKFTLSGTPGQGGFSKDADVLTSMLNEGGLFNFKLNYVDLSAVFRPQYHYNYDRHEGLAIGGGGADYPDVDGNLEVNFKSGMDRTGHVDADGKPDAFLDDIIRKQRVETDFEKRKALMWDFQRHFASKMYFLHQPGDALGYKLAHAWLGNWGTFVSKLEGGEMNESGIHMWIDSSKKA